LDVSFARRSAWGLCGRNTAAADYAATFVPFAGAGQAVLWAASATNGAAS